MKPAKHVRNSIDSAPKRKRALTERTEEVGPAKRTRSNKQSGGGGRKNATASKDEKSKVQRPRSQLRNINDNKEEFNKLLQIKNLRRHDLLSNNLNCTQNLLNQFYPDEKDIINNATSFTDLGNTLNLKLSVEPLALNYEKRKLIKKPSYPKLTTKDEFKNYYDSIQIFKNNLENMIIPDMVFNIVVPADMLPRFLRICVRNIKNFIELKLVDGKRINIPEDIPEKPIFWIAVNDDYINTLNEFKKSGFGAENLLIVFSKDFIRLKEKELVVEYCQLSDFLYFDKHNFQDVKFNLENIVQSDNKMENGLYHYDAQFNISVDFITDDYTQFIYDLDMGNSVTRIPDINSYLRNSDNIDRSKDQYNINFILKLYSADLITWSESKINFKTEKIRNKILSHLLSFETIDRQKLLLKLDLHHLFRSSTVDEINERYNSFALILMRYSSIFLKSEIEQNVNIKKEAILQAELVSLSTKDINVKPEIKVEVNGHGYIDIHMYDNCKNIEIKMKLKANSQVKNLMQWSLSGFFQLRNYSNITLT